MISSIKRKSNISFSVICALYLCFCPACNRTIKTTVNEIGFDTVTVDQIYPSSSLPNLNCNLQISFVYPKSYNNAEALKNLQETFIEKAFSTRYANLSPQAAVDSFSNQYAQNFENFCKEYLSDENASDEDDSDEIAQLVDETTISYFLTLKNNIVYNQGNLLSFVVENEDYEGGAHGSHSIYGYVVNLDTGELLTEESFAGKNYKKNLSSIIVQKIAAANNLEDVTELENLGYNALDKIAPNGNFTIDNKGITYYFNEYEIAAYLVGITKVFIPYNELKVFITEENPIAALADL
jgi:hypothetical protein